MFFKQEVQRKYKMWVKYVLVLTLGFSSEIACTQVNELVELKSIVPNIQYDLKYATKDNFTGKRIYPKKTKHSFLMKDAANALKKIALALEQQGLGILVWDAYRPHRATVKFWKLIRDERYVANPAKGSNHNRGIAIDLSLYHLSSGAPLDMPTGFDHFTDTARHDFMALNNEKIKNRSFLKTIMEEYGFLSFQSEWWHYSWPNNKGYAILNIPFKRIIKK